MVQYYREARRLALNRTHPDRVKEKSDAARRQFPRPISAPTTPAPSTPAESSDSEAEEEEARAFEQDRHPPKFNA